MRAAVQHFVIPDTQVKYGVPVKHLEWIGRYGVEHCHGKPTRFVHLGDHFDMPSLSSYDKGKRAMENRRYATDVKYGKAGMDLLVGPLREHMDACPTCRDLWSFDFALGNHEHRIVRASDDDAQMEGWLDLSDLGLEDYGWTVHPYQEVFWLDGIAYSHVFYNPMTGRAYSGSNLETRLKTLGHSFTMGHQQSYKTAVIDTMAGRRRGLVAGRCYLHAEDYLGPQGNNQKPLMLVCHEVRNGDYDLMEISLEWLCRHYERKTLAQFLGRH